MPSEQILSDLETLTDWQDRYQTIIEAGEQLPPFPAALQTEQNKVTGCMSNVWLTAEQRDGKFFFHGTSDAVIVKGLVALALAVANGKTRAELQQLDFEKTFARINLAEHLSQTRRNGFSSLLKKIKTLTA
ncbi:MAG: SufE family protein [Hydrotalea sp.]|nr:SufE family protein [Hydrotalea sp.]